MIVPAPASAGECLARGNDEFLEVPYTAKYSRTRGPKQCKHPPRLSERKENAMSSSNPIDDLAELLAAEAERQRLEAEAKTAESAPAPAPTPDISAALEKLTQTLAKSAPIPIPAAQPTGGTERTADGKNSH